jgi:hypothetical protein
MGLALLCGIYLASKLHVWSQFYVQWGIAVIVVLGALGGMYFAPRERKLGELAARDVASASDGEVIFSAEYKALRQQVFRVNLVGNILILLTIYFMTAQTG